MVNIGVQQNGDDFFAVINNPSINYRLVGAAFRARKDFDAYGRAVADAKDWQAKFVKAGIKANLVDVVS